MSRLKHFTSTFLPLIMARFMDLNVRPNRNFEELFDPLQHLSDDQLYKRYRFDRDSLAYIIDRLSPRLQTETNRNCPIPPEIKVLSTLSYLASNSYQLTVSDTFNMSQPSVSRSITSVLDAICEVLFPELVYFPNTEPQLADVKRGFFDVAGFPNVVTCIDGTHIRILAPKEREQDYINRKSYHSLNIMAGCDHQGRFTSVLAKYPGSCHDSFVLQDSRLWDAFETGRLTGNILGDSGYPSKPWLYTPYLHPVTAAQRNFNRAHTRTRVIIEQSFGRLKRRWGILHQEIRVKPGKAAKMFCACCALHNLAIERRQPAELLDDQPEGYAQPVLVPYVGRQNNGAAHRDHLANSFFA